MMAVLLLIIIYISFVSMGLQNSLLGVAWPSMYGEISVPVSYMGIVSMITMGCTVFANLLIGKIAERFETGKIVVIGVLMIAIALLGFTISDNFILFCASAAPLGMGLGFTDTLLNNFMAVHFKARHMNWLHCFWGVGAALGPIILSYGLRSGTWRSGYQIVCIIHFCLVIAMIFVSPLWKRIGKITARKIETKEESFKFGELFQLRGMKCTLVSFFCCCALETIVGLWGSSYLTIEKNISTDSAARLISMYFFGITFGRLISGFLAVKADSRQMMRLGYILTAGGNLLILLPLDGVTYMISFFLMGLGLAPIFPVFLHMTPINFGNRYSQPVMGMQTASAAIGGTIIPPLFGSITSYIGYGCFPIFLGVLLIVMIAMMEILNQKIFIVQHGCCESKG